MRHGATDTWEVAARVMEGRPSSIIGQFPLGLVYQGLQVTLEVGGAGVDADVIARRWGGSLKEVSIRRRISLLRGKGRNAKGRDA